MLYLTLVKCKHEVSLTLTHYTTVGDKQEHLFIDDKRQVTIGNINKLCYKLLLLSLFHDALVKAVVVQPVKLEPDLLGLSGEAQCSGVLYPAWLLQGRVREVSC